jgi:glutathione synthase/RimK-type ligase-like ATP-grasp enzyme
VTASRLAILTPDPSDEDRYDDWHEQAALIERLLPDVAVDYQPWSASLTAASMTLPVMAWGYHRHLDRWYAALDAWEAADAHFANPVKVLRWNTDKAYLGDLAGRGVPIVPTQVIAHLDAAALADAGKALGARELVIKPAVSAGSDETYRIAPDAPIPATVMGRRMLVQPMMPAILESGEMSIFFLGGTLAHAIVKHVRHGDFRVQPQFGGVVQAVEPPQRALQRAHSALAASGDDLLYARVDLVADGADWRIMEIELIEPWLYLDNARDGGAAFGAAIRGRLEHSIGMTARSR